MSGEQPSNNVRDIAAAERDKRSDALATGDLANAIRRDRTRFTRTVPDPVLLTMSPIYIQAGARHILYGGTGIGKSLIAQRAAVEVALRGYKVIYFAGESYEDEFDDRLQCIVRGLGYEPDSPQHADIFDTLSENLLDLSSASFNLLESKRQLRAIRDADEPDLVIFDPYVTYASGSENDVETARDFTVALNRLFISRGIAVLILHHSGKGSDGTDAENMRGSSHLPSWAQLTYRVTAVDMDSHHTRMTIECKKGRPKRKPELVAFDRILSEDLTTTYFRPATADTADNERAERAAVKPDEAKELSPDDIVPRDVLPAYDDSDKRPPAEILRDLMIIHDNRSWTRFEVEYVTGRSATVAKNLLRAMCETRIIGTTGMVKVGKTKLPAYRYLPQK